MLALRVARRYLTAVRSLSNWVHDGYMDGLEGKNPDPRLEGSEYDDGWLAGSEAKSRGFRPPKYYGFCESLPIKKDDIITIPKGTDILHTGSRKVLRKNNRTYKVKITNVYNGTPAYKGYHEREVTPPTTPVVVWAGGGSQWQSADINDIPEAR